VSYSDESKIDFLGVRRQTIAESGAVSDETCTEMAHGVRSRTGATWGVATTGVAGPTGGTAKKPVGLTYLCAAWDGGSRVKRMRYRGDRAIIRERAARGALWLLFDRLVGE
jgi:PncC family amidohydrolase